MRTLCVLSPAAATVLVKAFFLSFSEHVSGYLLYHEEVKRRG